MNDNNILEFRDITKHFPNFTLDHLTFHLPRGYIMGLIGANGAGKTTAVRLILNMLDPDGGEIRVFGLDSRRQEKEIKEQTGAVFDSSFFPDTWTVDDTERAISPFYREWNPQTFRQMIRRFRLPARTKIGELSRGMQMKLMLACALSHNARLLILDEPTSGLDRPPGMNFWTFSRNTSAMEKKAFSSPPTSPPIWSGPPTTSPVWTGES